MSRRTDNTSTNPLEPVIGRQLSAVAFIQDYVQLQFDGPSLTALNWPVVMLGEKSYEFGMSEYRNMLCERITKIVRKASVVESEEIRLEFDDEAIVLVSLKPPEDPRIAEIAIFDNGPADFWVWNS